MTNTQIIDETKDYSLSEFLPGEDPDERRTDTPLITGGILDSIATVQLVGYLEKNFDVQFQAHEMNADYLDTLDLIADTVESKKVV